MPASIRLVPELVTRIPLFGGLILRRLWWVYEYDLYRTWCFGRKKYIIFFHAFHQQSRKTMIFQRPRDQGFEECHDIQGRLSQNADLTVHDVGRAERVTAAYIYTLLRLPWLAPDITTAIVNGRQPLQLNAKTLMRKASRLPVEWAEQRALLGF
jgi:hypothetical protein